MRSKSKWASRWTSRRKRSSEKDKWTSQRLSRSRMRKAKTQERAWRISSSTIKRNSLQRTAFKTVFWGTRTDLKRKSFLSLSREARTRLENLLRGGVGCQRLTLNFLRKNCTTHSRSRVLTLRGRSLMELSPHKRILSLLKTRIESKDSRLTLRTRLRALIPCLRSPRARCTTLSSENYSIIQRLIRELSFSGSWRSSKWSLTQVASWLVIWTR